MNEIAEYLSTSYRREVLRESVEVKVPPITPEAIEAAKEKLKSIDALKLGANLVNRDFVAYQDRRALLAFLAMAEQQQKEQSS
jgi:hypothetical protein